MSGSLGGSKAKSESDSYNYGSNVWGPQQGYLTDVWGRGQAMSQQPVGGMGSLDMAGQQLGQAGQMIGYGGQQLGQANQYLAGMAAPAQGVNPQLQAYANQVGQLYNEQIMPAMQGQAAAAGQLGSSRAQLGQAQAAGAAQRNLQDFAGQQYQADQQRQLQAAMALQQGGAQYGQLGTQAAALSGGYSRLAQQQALMPWTNLQAFSGLLGAPIMQDLGGFNTSKSRSGSFSSSAGLW